MEIQFFFFLSSLTRAVRILAEDFRTLRGRRFRGRRPDRRDGRAAAATVTVVRLAAAAAAVGTPRRRAG